MKISTSKPTITKKWPIEVPTQTYDSVASVFKVWFGKHYLIWKGKSMLQAAKFLAENIERNIRLQKDNEGDYLYHVVNHIKRTRCIGAKVEVLENEFERGESATINCLKLLKSEQRYLDEAMSDPACLNNNDQAYISQWMPAKEVEKFLEYYESTNESRQKKLSKKTTT